MIPSICWVECGVADAEPAILKLDADELADLIENTKKNLNLAAGDNVQDELQMGDAVDVTPKEEEWDTKNEFNMDEYDGEEEGVSKLIFGAGLSGVAYYPNPEDDPYITLPQIAKEEDENYQIRPNDNFICCAKLDGDMSTIEVHLWNIDEEDFYVHHDILLDTFPLSIEWLSYDAGHEVEQGDRQCGNYVALGCMSPKIELWDLDIINTSEPVATLGERRKASKKKPKIGKKGHSDAVMGMSWNKHTQNVLASASVDTHILLWDLETCTAKECLDHHTDKVQTVAWHLAESTTLLSGSYDQYCHVVDCRSKSSKNWKLDGEVEQVLWDVSSPFSFLAGTSTGNVFSIDIRNEKPVFTLSAHNSEVSGLAMTRHVRGLLATCSADKTVKLWDVSGSTANCVVARDFPEAGSLHCLSFCPDHKTMLAIGGLEGGLLMWDTATSKVVRDHFRSRLL